MDLAKLQQLKQKLQHEKELATVWAFFMDHFMEQPEFIKLGERAHDAFVEMVLAQVGKQLFADEGKVGHFLLTRVAEQQFLHGGFFMLDRIGGVIYFEDVQMGLIAVSEGLRSDNVHYARFTGAFVKKQHEPSNN